jgi:DNA repair photolyase
VRYQTPGSPKERNPCHYTSFALCRSSTCLFLGQVRGRGKVPGPLFRVQKLVDRALRVRYNTTIERLFTRKVVIARGVLDDPLCRDRLDALRSRIEAESVEIVDDEAVEGTLMALGPRKKLQRGGLERRRRPKDLVVFTRLSTGGVFPGYSWRELRNGAHERNGNGVLCHTAVEIQSAVGCPFDCTYCPYSSFVCACLDVESFVDRVAELAMVRRSQLLFKLNNRSDTLGLEPEYDLAPGLVERFAELDGPYLMLYSKGTEVDSLTQLEHRGKTIASFTLTPEPLATLLETGAPAPAARLAAIARLAEAGYPIRVRLSPIVPLYGWREAYGDLVSRLLEAATPELVTLWTLSMIDLERLDAIVPRQMLDDEALVAAEVAAEEMRGQKGAPFPPDLRALIYREVAEMVRARSPMTEVALCLETADVWDAVGAAVVPRRGGGFVCNCGPRATPESVMQVRRCRQAIEKPRR